MGQRLTVYIVEDDPAIAEALATYVISRGLNSVSYSSSEQLLKALPLAEPACLLLDVGLPGMTGLEILSRLTHLDSLPTTIVITGLKDPLLEAEALALGAIAVLEKPFGIQELREPMEEAIRRGNSAGD